MAYTGRDWDNTGTNVTKEDFKRIETGTKNNDTAITQQATNIETITNQINDLSKEPIIMSVTLKDGILLNTNSNITINELIKQKGFVNLMIRVCNADGSAFTQGTNFTAICSLPTGFYKAGKYITFNCNLYSSNSVASFIGFGLVLIYGDGTVRVYVPTGITNALEASIGINFYVGGGTV